MIMPDQAPQYYSPPTQVNVGKSGNGPTYSIPSGQLSPIQHWPTLPKNLGSVQELQQYAGRNLGDYWGQLLGTSRNIRNTGLADLMRSASQNFENIYAGQSTDQASNLRAQQRQQALSSAAARGMGQSGALDKALRSIDLGYLGNVAKGQQAAYTQESQRQAGLADQIGNVVNSDIDFYKYINAGRDVAIGRAQPVSINALAGITRGVSGLAAGLWPKSPDPSVNTGGANNGLYPGVNYPGSNGISGINFGGGSIGLDSSGGGYSDEFGTRFGY